MLVLVGAVVLGLDARAQEPSPTAPPPTGPQAVVETQQGRFVVRLLPDLAPRHVRHFVTTAKAGGFDGTTFHRIIPMGIIQGGDPLTKDPGKAALYGTGGLGLLKAEFSDRPMKRGVVAAVLRPRQPNSAGNQFFVCITDQPALTGQYTIFGEVVEGMDVVDAIGQTPVDGDRPRTRVEIRKVTVRDQSP
jgi:peptidyl-prolyl cis-trans isomerase B (cyclophilin B)